MAAMQITSLHQEKFSVPTEFVNEHEKLFKVSKFTNKHYYLQPYLSQSGSTKHQYASF
jgi:hypothetical protein